MQWAIVATRILLPLGFLIALLQAELFAGRALRILLERLAARPSPEQWRDSVAEALDDPTLRLATATRRRPVPGAVGPPLAAGAGRAAACGCRSTATASRWPRW